MILSTLDTPARLIIQAKRKSLGASLRSKGKYTIATSQDFVALNSLGGRLEVPNVSR